jgi:hypothetical protein
MWKLKFNLFLVFSLLILPKIPLSNIGERQYQQGILLGEILLILSLIFNLNDIKNSIKNYKINKLLFFFYLFIFFYVLNSSIISGLFNGIFPSHSFFYFLRLSIYILLPSIILVLYKYNNTDIFWYGIIKKSYIFHGFLSLSIYIFYFLKFNPSFNDSLWTSEVGYRLLPLVGLAFNPLSSDFFYSIGGGSSNLLGTWTVFFILCVIFFEEKKKNRFILYSFSFLLLLLSQTRGGLISFFLTLLFSFFILKKIRSGVITISVLFFGLFIFSSLYISSIDLNSTLPIISRLFDSYKDGTFDSSTAGRFENYFDIFQVWISNPIYLFFGIGFDDNILFYVSKWTLVESFYLSVLYSGGVLSFLFFLFFCVKVFTLRNQNLWMSILFYFILLNSIVNWSITGSDILSVVGFFPIIFLITIGSLKKK